MINKYLNIYKGVYSSKEIRIRNLSWIFKFALLAIIFGTWFITLQTILSNISDGIAIFIVILGIALSLFTYSKGLDSAVKKQQFNNMVEFNNYRKKQFLEKSEIVKLNDNQLNILIEYIKNYSKGFKEPVFLKAGTLLVLLIPVYSSFVDTIFDKSSVNVVELVMLFIAIMIIIFIIVIFYVNIKNLLNDFIYKDYNTLQKIINILEEEYLNRIIDQNSSVLYLGNIQRIKH